MAGTKVLSDGKWRVSFVPTVVDFHAPTAAEANGGLLLHDIVSANNFELGATGENTVDDPPLSSTTNDQAPGKTTMTAAMEFYRFQEDEADVAWDTFTESGIGGYLIWRTNKPADEPFAAGEDVGCMQVLTGNPRPLPPSGGFEKFALTFYPQGAGTDLRAQVA